MLVDNPVAFVHEKFANLCTHLERTYAFDVTAMRAVPQTALYVLLRQHLLPHVALVEAGDAEGLIAAISDPTTAQLAVHCQCDAKVMRYLKLFCELIA
jgi:hypothetical protein